MASTTPCRGVSLLRETDKDFLITRLIQQIEDLHISLTSIRRSGTPWACEPLICGSSPDPVHILRHHHNNQLRTLTHRWKRLGLPHSATRTRDVYTTGHSQDVFKTEPPLKITPIQASPTVALRDRRGGNVERMKGSPISDTGIPEVEVNDTRSTNDTAVPFQFHSDNSDLSDQEKESVQVSKGAAPVDLNLRPEPFETDLDCACSPETAQVYPEVLPAPLKCLDFTPGMSSTAGPEGQQRLLSDPCLAPMVARLMELERLQAATVQKERVKPARSCPATANTGTRNSSRLRKGDLPGSRSGTAGDADCTSVACGLTRLSLCPNSLSRCRHLSCPLTKSGQGCVPGGQDSWLNLTLPKEPCVTSDKLIQPRTPVPASSVSGNVLPKSKLNRTKRLRATKKGTSKPQRENYAYSRRILATLSRKT